MSAEIPIGQGVIDEMFGYWRSSTESSLYPNALWLFFTLRDHLGEGYDVEIEVEESSVGADFRDFCVGEDGSSIFCISSDQEEGSLDLVIGLADGVLALQGPTRAYHVLSRDDVLNIKLVKP